METTKMLFYWQAISRWALIIFAGLMPVFFLPFTQLPVAVHKEIFALVLVLIAFFALLGKILVEGKIRYPGHWLVISLAVLVLVWSISAGDSPSQVPSYGRLMQTLNSLREI